MDDENRKIKKKRGREPAKEKEKPALKDAEDDDEELPDAPAAAKKIRKTRLNKLLKQHGATPKKKGTSSNTKASPKKHSPRKMKKVLASLEKVKEADPPGMSPPATITNQLLASKQFA